MTRKTAPFIYETEQEMPPGKIPQYQRPDGKTVFSGCCDGVRAYGNLWKWNPVSGLESIRAFHKKKFFARNRTSFRNDAAVFWFLIKFLLNRKIGMRQRDARSST
jgi:hypothetical protein